MTNSADDKSHMLTAMQVCERLDISARTLDSWYKYVKSDIEKPKEMPFVPMYTQHHPKGQRFWKSEDVEALIDFKKWIPKGRLGVMGRINQVYWKPELRKDS